jgi:ribonuclease P protein component
MKFTAIRENHLYVKAYHGGKRATSRSCSVYVLKDRQARRYMKARPDKQYINRIGISASKKIGGAVQRSRAKRVIREALRLLMREYRLKTGFLLVIAARQNATVCKMQDVYRDLQYALGKLDMFFVPPAETSVKTESSDTEIRA